MESSLTLDQFDLESEVGDLAGFGMGERFDDTPWTDEQQRIITRCVHSGLSWVYQTEEMQGIPAAYDWSWLQPTSTLELPEGEITIPLPDDFGGLNGRIIPASTESLQFDIAVVGAGELYSARSGNTSTGRPCLAYIEPIKGVTANRSSRYQLQIFPEPDADYTLQVWYYLLPNATSDMLPQVYGGAAHRETFKAAVRAAYERYYDKIAPDSADAVEQKSFISRLRSSIAYDRRFKPMVLGPNLDGSDDGYVGRHREYDRVPMFVNSTETGYP